MSAATSHANIVARADAFYLDWEAACNLCEDEFGGCTFGWYVRDFMHSVGWTDAEIDAREDLFAVRALAKALKDLAQRGTHSDLNPTRRIPPFMAREWAEADSWWVGYLGRADENVRTRARGALRDAGVEE